MEINLILFSSPLHGEIKLSPKRREIIEHFKKYGNVKISDEKSLDFSKKNYEEGLNILYILTGGTEESFLNRFPLLNRPIIILSDSYDNSLAAALEICTSLFNNHIEHYHINAPLIIGDSFVKKLNDSMTMFKKIMHGQKVLFGMKIGILGESSPWLIASGINKTTVQEDFKIKFISIQVEELIEEYKSFSRNYTESKIDEFVKEVDKMVALYHSHLSEGRTEADLREAVIMYFAIYDICKKYKLDAVTIRCFSLINSCKTTACLALAILNDKGIIAGCEGDIPALLSMASVAKLTKEPCFMANISSIDTDNYSIDLSHCTIPLSMTKKFSLPSHFESRKGIGINGIVQEGNYTLFKFSGMNMEQSILCPGRVVKCDYLKERCRTQIRFVFDNKEDFNKFLNCRIANHVVINKTVDI